LASANQGANAAAANSLKKAHLFGSPCISRQSWPRAATPMHAQQPAQAAAVPAESLDGAAIVGVIARIFTPGGVIALVVRFITGAASGRGRALAPRRTISPRPIPTTLDGRPVEGKDHRLASFCSPNNPPGAARGP